MITETNPIIVIMSLQEFDEMRLKIDNADLILKENERLAKIVGKFPELLKSRMSNVLEKMQNTINPNHKLNKCIVLVSSELPVINGMEIVIENPNSDGYYNALIKCNYEGVPDSWQK